MVLRRCALFLIISSLCLAQGSAPQIAERMDQVVHTFASSGKFMGAVLVARGDEILLNKGYGSANLEWDIPNAADVKFRLGSVTKQFTAACVLLLEERGELSVEDLVSKHLPDAPEAWSAITIRHLLTHTAGLPNITNFPESRQFQLSAMTAEEIVAKFRDKPLDFAPAEKMSYSNSGYILLGYLIEKVSGSSYVDFVQANIFTPLAMTDSGYDSNSAIIKRRAGGYALSPNGPVNAGYIHMSVPFAAGALYSTTGDLLKWQRALYGGKLLSAASLEKMTTPFLNDYAFGLTISEQDGRKRIQHSGTIHGFKTSLAYYPDSEVSIVVLGNLNGQAPDQIAQFGNLNGQAPDQIGAQLGTIAHGEQVKLISERREITLPREELQAYVGVYQLAPQVTISMTLDEDQLMAQMSGEGKLPVFPESDGYFFLKVVDAQLEFAKDDAGVVTSVTLHQNGRDQTATRISTTVTERTEITVAPEILQAYAGHYAFRPGIDMVVTLEDGKLFTKLGAQPKLPIFAESKTSFFAKAVDAQIEFTKDASGAVAALVIHLGPNNITAPRK